MTGKMSVEMEEVFLFDRSLIVCHNKGKTGLFGMEDEYSFWIRFPMNTLKVGVNFNFLWNPVAGGGPRSRGSELYCR